MAIDLLLDNLDKSKPINVYEMVQSLRHQRSSMVTHHPLKHKLFMQVQTPQQYATIYEAIALAIRNRQRLFLRDNSDRTVWGICFAKRTTAAKQSNNQEQLIPLRSSS